MLESRISRHSPRQADFALGQERMQEVALSCTQVTAAGGAAATAGGDDDPLAVDERPPTYECCDEAAVTFGCAWDPSGRDPDFADMADSPSPCSSSRGGSRGGPSCTPAPPAPGMLPRLALTPTIDRDRLPSLSALKSASTLASAAWSSRRASWSGAMGR